MPAIKKVISRSEPESGSVIKKYTSEEVTLEAGEASFIDLSIDKDLYPISQAFGPDDTRQFHLQLVAHDNDPANLRFLMKEAYFSVSQINSSHTQLATPNNGKDISFDADYKDNWPRNIQGINGVNEGEVKVEVNLIQNPNSSPEGEMVIRLYFRNTGISNNVSCRLSFTPAI